MPNQPDPNKHPVRIWIDRDLWRLFGDVAGERERSAEIANYVRWRTGDPDVTLPEPAERSAPTSRDS